MTQPVQEPSLERQVSGVEYRARQLARRPSAAIAGSVNIPWIRLASFTTQTFAADDRLGVVYPDSVTNEYPDIFDYDTTGGIPWAVLLLTTGLYQASVWVSVGSPEPESGFSLELLGTDYMEGLGGYHSRYYPGYTTGSAIFPPTDPGFPFTSAVSERIEATFMGNDEFFAGGQWEIESYISTIDTVDILSASLEVRRLGNVDFFPYPSGS